MEYRHPYMAEVFGAHVRERSTDVVHAFHLRHVGADLIDATKAQGRAVCVSLMDFWFLCPRVILMKSDGTACDGPPDGGRGCLPCHAPELAQKLAEHPAAESLARLQASANAPSKPAWDLRSKVATHHERFAYLRDRLHAADAVIAPTRFLRDVFVKNGHDAAHITHLGYGIDTTGLAAGAGAGAGAAAAAAAAARAARPLTFGFLGSFAPHKAPHVLVEAMALVKGDCRALLRGRATDFTDYSTPLVEACRRDPRITVAGAYERRELPAVLAAIDVLVVPSTWHENAPFVVLEARAAGIPVLASRFGGLVEVVCDDVDGELFAPGDVRDLAARLQRLVDEPARVARYRAAVQPPKTLAVAVDEFEAMYRRAAHG
jgi:glycosyltransferase involved in cell wall biosynthesis